MQKFDYGNWYLNCITSNLVDQWKLTEIDNYKLVVIEFIGELEKLVKRKQRYGMWVHKWVYDIRQF